MTCNKNNEPITKTIYNLPDQNSFIIFNNQLSALYRIQYDEHNYRLIIATLNSVDYDKIHILNRVQFIADVLDFAYVGRISYAIALETLNYLKRETEYLPWKSVMNHLSLIEHSLLQCPFLAKIKDYIRNLLEPIYNRLGGITAAPDPTDIYAIKHHELISYW